MQEPPRAAAGSGERARSRLLAAALAGPATALLLSIAPLGSQDLARLSVETVATGLESATVITHAGDDRLFVGLREGSIRIVRDGIVLPAPLIDLSEQVLGASEEGLLGLAFPPDHGDTGHLYVDYVGLDGTLRLSRFMVGADPDRADPDTEVTILEIPQPASGHYGGSLQFASDGTLYLSTGDGVGSAPDPTCRSQALDSLLGKVLRLDVSDAAAPGEGPPYSIPSTNPFASTPGARPEIWATGLRNPWRMAFDTSTGDLFVPDVGLGMREEINVQPASSPGGENYGWKVNEGSLCRDDASGCAAEQPPCGSSAYTPPTLEYGHDEGCAVIGGVVYRGDSISDLLGRYVFGDYCSGRLWVAAPQDGWARQALVPTLRGLTTIGEDAAGEIHLAAAGALYRLVDPAASDDPGLLAFTNVQFDAVERSGAAAIDVSRSGGSRGAVSVRYATVGGTAVAGIDYQPVEGVLEWPNGDTASRSFQVPIVDDAFPGPDLAVGLSLSMPSGGARLPSSPLAILTILDDDRSSTRCLETATTLCLVGGRFEVTVDWRSTAGSALPARWVRMSDDAAYFWFFTEPNPEVFVKLIDACVEPFQHFWMFASGLTDVEATLRVLDTQTGVERTYVSPQGQVFLPIQDVGTFDTCP
ncbi:MAG TPA: PQQ-dependent sugar dehydrogenase [Thermoanaerobaculia bacterium]|nr:PQQ-dependent sugar dehydrogenase [Thermoanaerobaculia bacterium]